MPSDYAVMETVAVRRVEIFTGAGRRRSWSEEAKRQIAAESYRSLETACAVARRYGLSPTQLFTWRRSFRTPAAQSAEPMFAPVVVEPLKPEPAPPRREARRPRQGGVELEIDGVVVRVGSDASAKTVAAVIGLGVDSIRRRWPLSMRPIARLNVPWRICQALPACCRSTAMAATAPWPRATPCVGALLVACPSALLRANPGRPRADRDRGAGTDPGPLRRRRPISADKTPRRAWPPGDRILSR